MICQHMGNPVHSFIHLPVRARFLIAPRSVCVCTVYDRVAALRCAASLYLFFAVCVAPNAWRKLPL